MGLVNRVLKRRNTKTAAGICPEDARVWTKDGGVNGSYPNARRLANRPRSIVRACIAVWEREQVKPNNLTIRQWSIVGQYDYLGYGFVVWAHFHRFPTTNPSPNPSPYM